MKIRHWNVPAETTQTARPTDRRMLQRFWQFLRPHKRWLFLSLALMPLATLAQLAGPWIIKRAVDEQLMQGQMEALYTSVLLFLAVLVLEYIFRVIERFSLVHCGIQTLKDLRAHLMRHIIQQPVSLFERRPIGSLVSRVTSDVESLMETLSMGVVTIVSDALLLLGILTAMTLLSWHLTVVSLAVVIPVAIIINVYRKRLRTFYDRIRKHTGRMNGILNEAASGLKEVQLFRYQKPMQKRFAGANADYFKDSMQVVGFDAGMYSMVDGMGLLAIAFMAFYGTHLLIQGEVTIGVLVAFITYIQRFFAPIKELSSKMATLQGGLAAMGRLFELLDHDERQPWGSLRAEAFEPSVRFEGVWFVYPTRLAEARAELLETDRLTEEALEQGAVQDWPEALRERFAVKGVDFAIQPGERVALVGLTGSGKTTLVKLLNGLYPPTRGQVSVSNISVTDYEQRAYQARVGWVPQEVHLFADTVRFNLTLGNPAISDAVLEEACRIVQADGFIRALPQGYDTVLEPGGMNLSQGQRQLLAFARVLAWAPDLVILDEATASVDSHSEQLIQAAILEMLKLKTTLVIAHRLATIQHCDRILVMHEGRLVEEGTHESLLAKEEGYYKGLYHAQFSTG